MIIVDTSVWIDHFRSGNAKLAELLASQRVLMHPFVIDERACGGLKDRSQILRDLTRLPVARAAAHNDVLRLIVKRKLWGKGIVWIDAHLLASALISRCTLWSLDKQLVKLAAALGVA